MKHKLIIPALLYLTTGTVLYGQNHSKYADIDSLLNTSSMMDAMTALDHLEENYKRDTADAEYWLRYSKACYMFYDYGRAEFAIDMAIKISPESSVAHFEKGLLLNETGKIEGSLKSLNTAIQLRPVGEYFYWRGIVNQRLNNIIDAERDYNSAIKAGFETPELHINLAILLVGNENLTESLSHVNKAIYLDKTYAQAYSVRSKIHLYLLNLDSACIDNAKASGFGHKQLLDIPDSVCNGSFTAKMKFLGDVCASNKLYRQGVVAYSKLIDHNNLHSDYFLNRGYCYYMLKDFAHAEKDYLRALEFPEREEDLLYDNLSLLYYDKNDFIKSIEYATKRIELNPRNHVAYLDRGLCYRKLKEYAKAEEDFNKSLEIKPDFFRAFGYRSFLYLELGQYQRSYDDANRAIQINPEYGYAYIVLAQVKQKLSLPGVCTDLYKAKKYGEPEADWGIKEYCQ